MKSFPFSSNLKSAKMTGTKLEVVFNNGTEGFYHDVSQEQYEALCKAKSPGGHLREHIIGPKHLDGSPRHRWIKTK